MKKLEGRVAVVTASLSGIGYASAKMLAENGAVVYIAGFDEKLGKEVCDEIISNGGKAKFVYFNAFEKETCISCIEEVVKNENKIDILVNNYGGTDVRFDKDVVGGDSDKFLETIEINIRSVYLTSKTAIPYMIKNNGGSIINISSIGSIVPDLSRTAYCVSKAAINSLTQNIAMQYARNNIRCNAVLPGLTATPAALNNMSEEFLKDFMRHVPLNRMAKPEEIAATVLYYASDDSSFVTGMLHQVAGGFALGTPQYADYLK